MQLLCDIPQRRHISEDPNLSTDCRKNLSCQYFICIFIVPTCASRNPFHLYLITLMVRSCPLCNFIHPPTKFLYLSQSIFPSTSSRTSLLRGIFALQIGRRYQVSLSYKTTRKMHVCSLYVLTFLGLCTVCFSGR
jgi:hypothetical protein